MSKKFKWCLGWLLWCLPIFVVCVMVLLTVPLESTLLIVLGILAYVTCQHFGEKLVEENSG